MKLLYLLFFKVSSCRGMMSTLDVGESNLWWLRNKKINKYDDVTVVDIIMLLCFQMNMRFNWYLFNGLRHICEWYQYLMIHMFSFFNLWKSKDKRDTTTTRHPIGHKQVQLCLLKVTSSLLLHVNQKAAVTKRYMCFWNINP